LFSKHDLRLPPRQALILRAPQVHYRQRVTVEGKPGSTMNVRAPVVGTLNVLAVRETCEVWLDNENLHYPPITNERVAAGTYKVTLKCPDGDSESDAVTITSGETETKRFK